MMMINNIKQKVNQIVKSFKFSNLIEFKTLDDLSIYCEKLEAGVNVYSDMNNTALADGDYTIESNVITVVNGAIEAVNPTVKEDVQTENMEVQTEPIIEDVQTENANVELESKVEELSNQVKEVASVLQMIVEQMGLQIEEMKAIKEQPIKENFNKVEAKPKTKFQLWYEKQKRFS